jgi:hypothetical protein
MNPGLNHPQFADNSEVQAFGPLLHEFIREILGWTPHMVFISDESTLDQFEEGPDENYAAGILHRYGVDTSELPDQKIVTILAAIRDR